MRIDGKRTKRTRLIQKGRYVVAVEVEMVVPPDDPSEPCYEAETVEFLKQVYERAEQGDREHVELEAEPLLKGPVPLADRARQIAQRAERDDSRQRRFRSGALHDAADEERRRAARRHVQERLLHRAGVVVEVGVLKDQRRVEPSGEQVLLQRRQPPVELLERRARARGRRCVRGPLGHRSPGPVR